MAYTAPSYITASLSTVSQDITNNKSVVRIKVTLYPNGAQGYNLIGADGSITLNGSTVSFSSTFDFQNSQSAKVIATKDFTVTHDSDGTKTIKYSVKFVGDTTSVPTLTTSGSYTIKTIPRATVVSGFTAYFEDKVTISLPRASSSFTHDLTYKFGSASGTIATGAGTSASWTVPSSLASQIPKSLSSTGTLTCKTYSGSTLIGTKTATFTLKVPDSYIPSFDSCTLTPDNPSQFSGDLASIYVAGYSKCKITFNNAKGGTGADTNGCIINDVTYKTLTNSISLKSSGTITFSVKLKDTRGRTSEAKTYSISVYAYSVPKITAFSVKRWNTTDDIEDESSETIKVVSASVSYTSLDNKNTLYKVIYYKLSDATSWDVLSSGSASDDLTGVVSDKTFAFDKVYDFKMVVYDTVVTSSYNLYSTCTVDTDAGIIDILKGGLGVAIGGMASIAERFEVFWNTVLRKNLSVLGDTKISGKETVTGVSKQEGGHYVSCSGYNSSGYTGSVLVAVFTISASYQNVPIILEIAQRGKVATSRLYIRFNSANSADPGLDYFLYDGDDISAYMFKMATSRWGVLITKTETYDKISVVDYKTNFKHMTGVSVEWKDINYTEIPDGSKQATRCTNQAGSVDILIGGRVRKMIEAVACDSAGDGMLIRGGGGLMMIGCGEGVNAAYSGITGDGKKAGSEVTYITGDNEIILFTNLQNGYDSRKTFDFTANGNLAMQGNITLGNTGYNFETGVSWKWADGNGHWALVRSTNGLACYVGWLGSSSYKTSVTLRGQSCAYSNASGTTSLSDKNLKKDIYALSDEKYDTFFDNLIPVEFKYILGTSGRPHIGFIAQDVEDALEKAGMATADFGGVNIMSITDRETEEDADGNIIDMEGSSDNYLLDNDIHEEHGLIYTEFIALNTMQIQKLKSKVAEQEKTIESLQNQINELYNLLTNKED